MFPRATVGSICIRLSGLPVVLSQRCTAPKAEPASAIACPGLAGLPQGRIRLTENQNNFPFQRLVLHEQPMAILLRAVQMGVPWVRTRPPTGPLQSRTREDFMCGRGEGMGAFKPTLRTNFLKRAPVIEVLADPPTWPVTEFTESLEFNRLSGEFLGGTQHR